jgi:hypothetical protein
MTVTVVVATAVALLLMGRDPIDRSGSVKLWHGVVFSSENSQHLTDWYTFTHILHGFAIYALLWLVGARWPLGLRVVLATVIESSWEIVENTDAVINRYREATIALDYYGDSVINSVTDILAMLFGFALAARLPVYAILVTAAALEVGLAWAIRDNLTLNILMLLYPVEAVRVWQSGG